MRGQRLVRGVAAAIAGVAMLSALPAPAHAASQPSAVGDQNISWIAVSPAYQRTGLVVALGAPLTGCQGNCMKLWVTHNGGASWATAAATGWGGGRPVIAVDGSGREVLFAASSSLQRSVDDGQTWSTVASAGGVLPAPSPQFPSDGAVAVAVAGGQDYVLRGSSSQPVTGSGRTLEDLSFMYAPGYPWAGSHAPVLLAAADTTSAHNPVIQQCTAALACSGGATLPGSTSFSAPESLVPSTDYANDGVVFAQSGRGVYKSVNGGGSFAPLAIVPANGAAGTATPMLALAPNYKEAGPVRTVFAAVFQTFTDQKNPHTAGGIYRSTDGGATWSSVGSPSPLDSGADSVAVAPDGRLFAGYLEQSGQQASAGLLCSTNGTSWQATCPAVGGPGGSASSGAHPTGSAASCSGSGCGSGSSSPAASQGGAGATPAAGSGTQVGAGSASGATALGAPVAGGSGGMNGGLVALAAIGGLAVVVVTAIVLRRRAAARGPG